LKAIHAKDHKKKELENKRKKEAYKKRKRAEKERELDFLGLPLPLICQAHLYQRQLLPLVIQQLPELWMANMLQHRSLVRKQMHSLEQHLLLQQYIGHLEWYVFTIQGWLPEVGHQELEPCLKSDTTNMLEDY
jgi:hypothetical protein